MPIKKTRLAYFVLVTILLVFSVSAEAQKASSNDPATPNERQLLQELINEVRDLRISLQRANLNAYRAQITIERLNVQQRRFDGVSRQLEENQNELNSNKQSRVQLSARVKDIETEFNDEQNTDQRIQQENEIKELKKALEQQTEREAFLNDQQAKLANQLQTEQAKLDDICKELMTIEAEFQKMSNDTSKRK
ncbi:MAG: hypothetical protein AABO57_07740 [Acidobacteriota bacterium]